MTDAANVRLLPDDDPSLGEQTKLAWRTYGLDWKQGRITHFVDGLTALKQSIYKRLLTERGVFPIYGSEYGFAFFDLIGLAPAVVESEVARRMEETLLADERVAAVNDFSFQWDEEGLMASFRVESADGGSVRMEGRIQGL